VQYGSEVRFLRTPFGSGGKDAKSRANVARSMAPGTGMEVMADAPCVLRRWTRDSFRPRRRDWREPGFFDVSESREQVSLAQRAGIEAALPKMTPPAVMHAVHEYGILAMGARRKVKAIDVVSDGVTIQ
jgi:hypothetical protein